MAIGRRALVRNLPSMEKPKSVLSNTLIRLAQERFRLFTYRCRRGRRRRTMNERTRKIFDRTGDVTGKAARMTGKVALWSVVAGAGLWLLGKAGEIEAEEEAKKPPILAKFDGQDDTYTAPFTTHGPWQISWEGNLDIEIWRQHHDGTAGLYDSAGGNGGSAFYPSAGIFYLVIRRFEPTLRWTTTVRCR
jgi:hypothetical protein